MKYLLILFLSQPVFANSWIVMPYEGTQYTEQRFCPQTCYALIRDDGYRMDPTIVELSGRKLIENAEKKAAKEAQIKAEKEAEIKAAQEKIECIKRLKSADIDNADIPALRAIIKDLIEEFVRY